MIDQKFKWSSKNKNLHRPAIREDGVFQHNLLHQLYDLVGKVCGHEGFHLGQKLTGSRRKEEESRSYHRDENVLDILSLGKCSLHHLVDQRPLVLVLIRKNLEYDDYHLDQGVCRTHLCPELHVPPLIEVTGLRYEETVFVTDGDQLAVTVAPLEDLASQVRVSLLTVLAYNLR